MARADMLLVRARLLAASAVRKCSSLPLLLRHTLGSAAQPYVQPFLRDTDTPFLTCHAHDRTHTHAYSRAQFLRLGLRALKALKEAGVGHGHTHLHWFTRNSAQDLAFRWAAAVLGSVPVTVNWQADSTEGVAYKGTSAGCIAVVFDDGVDEPSLRELFPSLALIPAHALLDMTDVSEAELARMLSGHAPPVGSDRRMVIFTSGTTGRPKGVQLSYANYACNRATFESFLGYEDPSEALTCVLVNPLHHSNSSALSDWCMRRPQARLHLVERYSSSFWHTLCAISSEHSSSGDAPRLVVPLVSRHVDFLDSLVKSSLVDTELLKASLKRSTLLLGSAPVGSDIASRLRQHTGRLPLVRFGSTETTLQVCGIPPRLTEREQLDAWTRGRANGVQGLYLGRHHPPYTEVRVVRATDPSSPLFMQRTEEGELGKLVTRGGNVMLGYLNSSAVAAGAWYLGLGDEGFWLAAQDQEQEKGGAQDVFWVARSDGLLLRGGANYSTEQIRAELETFLEREYGLGAVHVRVAVCGVRTGEEHDHRLCVLLEPLGDTDLAAVQSSFLQRARTGVSKGAKPDRLLIGAVPMVPSKGVVAMGELRNMFLQPSSD